MAEDNDQYYERPFREATKHEAYIMHREVGTSK